MSAHSIPPKDQQVVDAALREAPHENVCRAPGCDKTISWDMLMCAKHWFTVPTAIRNRVWREFKKERGSREHVAAITEAINAVTEKLANQAGVRRKEPTNG